MKVIMLQNVNKIGKKDEVLEVSDGYARNYLLPKGLAEEASAGKMKLLNEARKAKKTKEDRLEVQAKEQARTIGGKRVTVKVNAGEGGRLFGTVTAQQLADAVSSQLGVEVDKRDIKFDGVKQLGVHPIKIRLYTGVEAELTVSVETLD